MFQSHEVPLKSIRIIPHRSVLNSSNRKLWRTIHGLLAMHDTPRSRLTAKDGVVTYRQKDDVWWVVKISPDDISFHVVLPERFGSVFETKMKNHQQWSRNTLRDDEVSIPDGTLWQLKFLRANMFSLDIDYTMQTSPVRDLMYVAQDMAEGEEVAVCIRLEAVGRKKWKALADYSWEVWNRGGVPQRSDLDVTRLSRAALRGVAQAAGKVKAVADDAIEAVENTMFAQNTKIEKESIVLVDPDRAELMVNGNLSRFTSQKRNLPAFLTSVQLAVKGNTPERTDMLAHSISTAFADLDGDNRLRLLRVARKHLSNLRHFTPPTYDRDRMMMSTDEVGKLIQLPTTDVQEEFEGRLEANRRIEIDIPRAFTKGIFAGTATVRGQTHNIHIPTADSDMLMTARAMIGSPRMGKDQAAVNLVVESHAHGIGAIIPDVIDERHGHRGMADAIRDHLPPEDVIDLDLSDFDYPVYIGLQGLGIGNQRIAQSRIAQELTNFLMGEDWQHYQTREYLREAAKATGGDLIGIRNMFTNAESRCIKIQELKNRERDVTLWEDYDGLPQGRQGQIFGPVAVRLGELMGDEALRPIFCQRPNPRVDLERWMREGKVVIYRIPSRVLGERAVQTLTHWIVLSVFLTKMTMREPVPTWLVLNEPHQFLSPGLVHFMKRLLTEGPKHRLGAVTIMHNFAQVPNDFVEILLSSSLNWHIFKNTNARVYERLLPYIEPTFDAATAMRGTQRYHYIASWLDSAGEYQTPFVAKAPDLVWERHPTRDNAELTKRHSRMYGRHIAMVERDIQRRGLGG